MSLLKRIIQDSKNNPNFKGKLLVISFTIASSFRKKVRGKVLFVLFSPVFIVYKLVTDFILGCEIPISTSIGHSLVIHHGRATVLNKNTVIGNGVTLKHNTTIGNKTVDGKDLGSPVIGNNVTIEPHSIIIGPITVGENSIIGAGSVVVKDVLPNTIVAGNPAKIIRKIEKE